MPSRHRCLVLGGGGFIGANLVRELLRQGHFVRCFGRPHLVHLFDKTPTEQFEYFAGDFLKGEDVSAALRECDTCFHLISTTIPSSSNRHPIFDVESNIAGTVSLLDRLVDNGVKNVIFLSSGGTVYGVPRVTPIPESHPTDPICSYGITKLAIEKYLKLYHELYGIRFQILRLSNPFGQGQRVESSQGAVAVFLGRAIRNEVIEIWGNGTVTRDFIYIGDVIAALLAALNSGTWNNILNIGSGCGRTLNTVISSIESLTRRKLMVKYLPGRGFDVPSNMLDISLAKSVLGWEPKVNFDDGLKLFYEWMLST